MDHFSVNKKLELMQQIRSRYSRDKSDLLHREKMLYGDEEESEFSTLPLRLFVAAAAFVLLVVSDRTGSGILGLSAEKCFRAISADYESSIAAWTDAASGIVLLDQGGTDHDDRPLKDNPPAGIRP